MMGLAPTAVDRETPASLLAAFEGLRQFHGVKQAEISDDEFLEILAAEQAAGRA